MSTSFTEKFSAQQLAWYCFCLIFPASALINGITPLRGEAGLYAFGGMLSIRAAAFLIPLGLAGMFWCYSILRGQLHIRRNPLHWVLLIMAVLIAVATLFAQEQTVALFGSRTNGQGALLWIGYLFCAFLASQLISSRKHMQQVMWVIVGTGTVVALLALGEVAGIINSGLPQHDWMLERGIATMYTSDHLGTFLVVPAILALGLALTNKSLVITNKSRELYVAVACTVPLVYSLVFTMTRGAWIGAFVGIVILSALLLMRSAKIPDQVRDDRKSHHPNPQAKIPMLSSLAQSGSWQRIAALWIALALVLLSFLTVFGGTEFTQRFEHAVTDFRIEGQALAGRGALWSVSLDLIAGSPLVGLGADNVIYAAPQSPEMQTLEREGSSLSLGSPHNVYLESALNFGLVFALILIGLVFLLAFRTLKSLFPQSASALQRKNKRSSHSENSSFTRQSGTHTDSPIIWISALLGLSVALIVAITNVAIMAMFFCLLGFLLRSFDQKVFYKNLQEKSTAGLITILAAGLLIYGSLEGASALRGNVHLRSPSATMQRSYGALDIAPWRKEPLRHMLQTSGTLLARGEISPEETYHVLNFVIEKDPLSPEPHIALAQVLIDFEGDHAQAQAHVERALELRPTSVTAQELLAEIELALEVRP